MLHIIHKILFKRHIFQFYLMLQKLHGVIVYGKFRYSFGFLNIETFYSLLYNEIKIQKVLCISNTF